MYTGRREKYSLHYGFRISRTGNSLEKWAARRHTIMYSCPVCSSILCPVFFVLYLMATILTSYEEKELNCE